jgi:hypothetical protein
MTTAFLCLGETQSASGRSVLDLAAAFPGRPKDREARAATGGYGAGDEFRNDASPMDMIALRQGNNPRDQRAKMVSKRLAHNARQKINGSTGRAANQPPNSSSSYYSPVQTGPQPETPSSKPAGAKTRDRRKARAEADEDSETRGTAVRRYRNMQAGRTRIRSHIDTTTTSCSRGCGGHSSAQEDHFGAVRGPYRS